MNHAHQRLARRQRADDVRADGLGAHGGDEVLDDRERDVGFEQREAHLAQRVLDVFVGQPRLAAQLLHDAAEPLGQVVEHGGAGGGLRERRPTAPDR